MPDDLVRLSKLMAARGMCSRREADGLIARGLVRVEGAVVDTLGQRVAPGSAIEIAPGGRRELVSKATILLNKPIGYVSSQPEDGHRAAVELISEATRFGPGTRRFEPGLRFGLAPAGRLDIDSQGLLVLTQNGVVAKKLIGENSKIEKEYLVRVGGRLSAADLVRLGDGSLEIDGRRLRPATVEWVNEDQLRFVLREGMKRQVRRMCEAVGLKVLGLKRVRIGKIRLGRLPEGQWRFLEPSEFFD